VDDSFQEQRKEFPVYHKRTWTPSDREKRPEKREELGEEKQQKEERWGARERVKKS
jgi:hypothetical protein